MILVTSVRAVCGFEHHCLDATVGLDQDVDARLVVAVDVDAAQHRSLVLDVVDQRDEVLRAGVLLKRYVEPRYMPQLAR